MILFVTRHCLIVKDQLTQLNAGDQKLAPVEFLISNIARLRPLPRTSARSLRKISGLPAGALAQAGGGKRDRTADPLLAKQVLFQLSYTPVKPASAVTTQRMVGLGRVELPTSPLSGVRSSQLSYRPSSPAETRNASAPCSLLLTCGPSLLASGPKISGN